MKLPPFLLDQWLVAHEFASPPIRYNFASSTGPSLTLGELMALCGDSKYHFEDVKLSYAPPEGDRTLRKLIAQFYGVDPDWIVTTTGASEALSLLYCLGSKPGGSVAVPFPNFSPMTVMAKAWGLEVVKYSLDRASRFALTADGVMAAVDESTQLVLVNTPHNPTGAVMQPSEVGQLAARLAERAIPLLVDEVYHPLYFGESLTSSANIDNAIVIGDFSKAFSLPGLRIGWIIERDPVRREQLIDLRSYLTISGSPLCEAVAVHALQHIDLILKRLSVIAQANLTALTQFMDSYKDRFDWVPPQGGTVAFPWQRDRSSSRPMCEVLARAGVLFVPGDCFSAPEHFRIGFGARATGIDEALAIVAKTIS